MKTAEEIQALLNDTTQTNDDKVSALESIHSKVQEEIENLPSGSRALVRQEQAIANAELDQINKVEFDFDSENRLRNAGFRPELAEQLAEVVQTKSVGQLFDFSNKLYVKTPFNTVVPAQLYVNALQEQVVGVVAELERLQTLTLEITGFKKLTFVGLIKLAFKRLFMKGKNNG